jgi:hypothetical protein
MRAVVGVAAGLLIGLLITVVVIAFKVGFFVNTPRAAHPFVLVSFFIVPGLVGGVIGALWRRPANRK